MFCAMETMAQNFNVAPALERHAGILCGTGMDGRRAGTEGEKQAALYVYEHFKDAGLDMLTNSDGQDFSIVSGTDSIHSCNIVGIVEGSDTKLKDEYIVVGAHFDGFGSHVVRIDGKQTVQFMPGADDNASGVAILLELAKLVSEWRFMFNRTVIFVGFGASEMGNAGSWYFLNRAFPHPEKIKAMINLDMLGRGTQASPFSMFSQMRQPELNLLLDKVSLEPVVLKPAAAPKELTPSDHLAFYDKGIPVVCFTTGKSREARTIKDVPSLLHYDKMEYACNYIYYFVKVLSCINTVPEAVIQVRQMPSESSTDGAKVYAVTDCDKRPQFFNSNERHFLESWVYKYLKYPRNAIRNGIQGKVLVTFIIEKDGSVTNVEIMEGIDEDLDEEVLRVVRVSPKWIPGKIDGKKVRVRMSLPIEFRLSADGPRFRVKK